VICQPLAGQAVSWVSSPPPLPMPLHCASSGGLGTSMIVPQRVFAPASLVHSRSPPRCPCTESAQSGFAWRVRMMLVFCA